METPRFIGFEILETLPGGGMSTVYKARQISLDRIVALKTLPLSLISDFADVEKFISEAKITANLKHTNIIQVYDFGKTSEGLYYYVMEFVSGYNIADWIIRKKALSEEDSLFVASSVADALGYAWVQAGVIHCDIKPDNIIIDSDGTIKIADLGLARSVRTMLVKTKQEDDGMVFGTPNYISPEQSRGDADLDCRADIYSLGAMLYHCMTGTMPFEGMPEDDVMDRQITDQIPDPQEVKHSVSSEASCLIEIMMAKNREHRQKDWTAVSRDIVRVLANQYPVKEIPPPGGSTIRRSPHRRIHAYKKDFAQSRRIIIPAVIPAAAGTGEESRPAKKPKPKSRTGLLVLGAAILVCIAVGITAFKIFKAGRIPDALIKPSGGKIVTGFTQILAKSHDAARPIAVQRQVKSAEEMFLYAVKWFEDNPAQFDEAIATFEKVAVETQGTKYSLMASSRSQKLRDAQKAADDAVMQSLHNQATAFVSRNQYQQAIECYQQYQGPRAARTASMRASIARELRERERAYKAEQRVILEELEVQWPIFIDELATDLVKGNVKGALAKVNKAEDSSPLAAKRQELKELKNILTTASQMDQRIIDSFKPQLGQEFTVQFVKGPETVKVLDVLNDAVRVERIWVIPEAGRVSRVHLLRVDELALSEKKNRVGAADQPTTALMHALLLVSAPESDLKTLESIFAKTGPLLSMPLLAKLEEKKNVEIENRAARVFRQLIRSARIELPEKMPDCAQCVKLIKSRKFDSKTAQSLKRYTKNYRNLYGKTKFAQQYGAALDSLAAIEKAGAPVPKGPTVPARPAVDGPRRSFGPEGKKTVARLLERNRHLKESSVSYQVNALGKVVRLGIHSQDIRDIKPLSALKELRELTISTGGSRSTALSDISALRGLPLTELNLSGTMIRDISGLLGMPLKKLNLSNTRVTDIMALRGLPLTDLNLSYLRLRDIRALAGMPLKRLNISHSDIVQITPLMGVKLSVLDASFTRIRDINALRNMPLTVLNLSNTDIADANVLSGMPLRHLDLAKTKVRDISALTGMQLETLNISRLNVKDISMLKGARLRVAILDGNKIKNINALLGMPIENLSLEDTDVQDLTVLASLSLKVLNLRGTKVKDLNQLRGLQLRSLNLCNTDVSNLSPLIGMPLTHLNIVQTDVRDIKPLLKMPLRSISLDYEPYSQFQHNSTRHAKFTDVLRRIRSLKSINGHSVFKLRAAGRRGW